MRSIEKSSDVIGNRTHDLLAFNVKPQPTMLPYTLDVTGVRRIA
jgi:hypothetical protein